MAPRIELIVGLGNPGAKYESTRHNVGFWFVDRLAQSKGARLRHETKFHGELGKLNIDGEPFWLLKPSTFMNNSGQAVAALANFYKIAPQQILVVHDELDIPPGALRLKEGGGHGGHNGLRDIVARLGSREFVRLRIGIGHPGSSRDVTNYVLGKPSPDDRGFVDQAIDEALANLPLVITGELQKAMNHLHSR